MEVLTQKIPLVHSTVELFIRREDLIHPFVSGNKFRKLKYNLREAKHQNKTVLLTFGGAFSNHIAATAYAGKENGFKTIGIIRGEELAAADATNPTLQFAADCGMELFFVSRREYRNKDKEEFLANLRQIHGDFYLIPEGGSNHLAVKGCEEILSENDFFYDYIATSVGTGGTISGLINAASSHQKVLGFTSLKGAFLTKDICKFATNSNWHLFEEYHFGGYGKVTEELVHFLNWFYQHYQIPLDPIYTGKMVFGIFDLIQKGYFDKGSKIMLIHTGGLQGIMGMNQYLKSKKRTLIAYDG